MVLVLAAMMEELQVALDLCSQRSRLSMRGVRVWHGISGGRPIHLMKTGVGPVRAGKSLERVLQTLSPDHLLVTGYAGALDRSLKIGDLIAGTQVRFIGTAAGENASGHGAVEPIPLADAEALSSLGKNRGLTLHGGGILTSDRLVGDPVEKRRLHEHFGAWIVDMETAALARIAHSRDIPLACVRAVTDEAEDDLLAPFSKATGTSEMGRAAKVLRAGRWRDRYEG